MNLNWCHKPHSSGLFYRKPVTEVIEPAKVVSSGGLRGSVTFSLRISEKSTIKQEIVLDACDPYIKFNTQVRADESLVVLIILRMKFRAQIYQEAC